MEVEQKEKTYMELYPEIADFLASIPEELWDDWCPDGEKELNLFETRLLWFKQKESRRKLVMSLQKKYGLPLRPNESLHHVKTLIRIQMWKKRKQEQRGNNELPL